MRANRILLRVALVAAILSVAYAANARSFVDDSTAPAYEVRPPEIDHIDGGLRVHGTVCRTNAETPAPALLLVERLSVEGAVLEQADARIYGLRAGRMLGCGYFTGETHWRLQPGDTIRVR